MLEQYLLPEIRDRGSNLARLLGRRILRLIRVSVVLLHRHVGHRCVESSNKLVAYAVLRLIEKIVREMLIGVDDGLRIHWVEDKLLRHALSLLWNEAMIRAA